MTILFRLNEPIFNEAVFQRTFHFIYKNMRKVGVYENSAEMKYNYFLVTYCQLKRVAWILLYSKYGIFS